MMYTILIIIALLLLALLAVLVLFVQGHAVKSKNIFSSETAPKDTAATMLANSTPPGQAPTAGQISQQRFSDSSTSGGFTDSGATRTPGRTRVTGAISGISSIQNNAQNYPSPAAYQRSLQELSPLTSYPPPAPPKAAHAQGRYELEQEYEHGMRTVYDEKVGAINFISMHVVMNTPAEVDLAFRVCKRQIRTVLRSRGLERAPTLTDIGGLVIGRDATAAWGQALKNYLEEMCIKIGKDTYLLAHYNSQADRPNRDQLQEKITRIQFMTSAAINNFQSNIFDTREEAVAFLQRMREVYRV